MVAVSNDINKMRNFFHGALVRLVASRCEYLNGHRDNNTRHCTEPTQGGSLGALSTVRDGSRNIYRYDKEHIY